MLGSVTEDIKMRRHCPDPPVIGVQWGDWHVSKSIKWDKLTLNSGWGQGGWLQDRPQNRGTIGTGVWGRGHKTVNCDIETLRSTELTYILWWSDVKARSNSHWHSYTQQGPRLIVLPAPWCFSICCNTSGLPHPTDTRRLGPPTATAASWGSIPQLDLIIPRCTEDHLALSENPSFMIQPPALLKHHYLHQGPWRTHLHHGISLVSCEATWLSNALSFTSETI